jgi:hypothetical protein
LKLKFSSFDYLCAAVKIDCALFCVVGYGIAREKKRNKGLIARHGLGATARQEFPDRGKVPRNNKHNAEECTLNWEEKAEKGSFFKLHSLKALPKGISSGLLIPVGQMAPPPPPYSHSNLSPQSFTRTTTSTIVTVTMV